MEEMIGKFQDQYMRQRIFVIGNGPSLNDTPLDQLRSEFTIALNGINQIYDSTRWRPTFYYSSNTPKADINPRVEYAKENLDLGIQCFLNREYKNVLGNEDNAFYFDRRSLRNDPLFSESGVHNLTIDEVEDLDRQRLYDFWSNDPSEIIYTYHSMFGVLQLIAYMGFDEIYLVGADLGFGYYNPHMLFDKGLDPYKYEGSKVSYIKSMLTESATIQSVANTAAYLSINKFDRGFNAISERLNPSGRSHMVSDYLNHPKDMRHVNEETIKSHIIAKRILSNEGIDIYNATLGGELEVYPRIDLNEIT